MAKAGTKAVMKYGTEEQKSKGHRTIFGDYIPYTLPFEDTATGKELGRISEEGIYSPEAKRSMIGQSTAMNQSIAQKREQDIKGNLIGTGFEGSIAGQRLLASPDVLTQRNVSQAARDIDLANELSKTSAKMEFATGSDAANAARKAEKQARKEAVYKFFGQSAAYLLSKGNPLATQFGGYAGTTAAGGTPQTDLAQMMYQNRLNKLKEMAEQSTISYYNNRGEKPFSVPTDLAKYDPIKLFEWATRNGIDPKMAEWLQFEMQYGEPSQSNYGTPTQTPYIGNFPATE